MFIYLFGSSEQQDLKVRGWTSARNSVRVHYNGIVLPKEEIINHMFFLCHQKGIVAFQTVQKPEISAVELQI